MPRIVANLPTQITHTSAKKSPFLLVREILARSEARTWASARDEWELLHVFFADRDDPGRCLCGKYPILELCVIGNRLNGNQAVVGNVCVTRFLDLPEAEDLFDSLRRIIRNPKAALSAEAIEHCYREGWLNDWERSFYIDTCKRRQPTPRQLAKRVEINESVIRQASSRREVDHA
jgi:hypothetical protein